MLAAQNIPTLSKETLEVIAEEFGFSSVDIFRTCIEKKGPFLTEAMELFKQYPWSTLDDTMEKIGEQVKEGKWWYLLNIDKTVLNQKNSTNACVQLVINGYCPDKECRYRHYGKDIAKIVDGMATTKNAIYPGLIHTHDNIDVENTNTYQEICTTLVMQQVCLNKNCKHRHAGSDIIQIRTYIDGLIQQLRERLKQQEKKMQYFDGKQQQQTYYPLFFP